MMNTPMPPEWILEYVLTANALGVLCTVGESPSGATHICIGTALHKKECFVFVEAHDGKVASKLAQAHCLELFKKKVELI